MSEAWYTGEEAARRLGLKPSGFPKFARKNKIRRKAVKRTEGRGGPSNVYSRQAVEALRAKRRGEKAKKKLTPQQIKIKNANTALSSIHPVVKLSQMFIAKAKELDVTISTIRIEITRVNREIIGEFDPPAAGTPRENHV